MLKLLHWLPIEQRIEFKILLLTFKARNKLAPEYISSLITPYTPGRTLRSLTADQRCIPKTKLKTGERAFQVAGPTLWNDLPSHIKKCKTVNDFKSKLKTHYFCTVF